MYLIWTPHTNKCLNYRYKSEMPILTADICVCVKKLACCCLCRMENGETNGLERCWGRKINKNTGDTSWWWSGGHHTDITQQGRQSQIDDWTTSAISLTMAGQHRWPPDRQRQTTDIFIEVLSSAMCVCVYLVHMQVRGEFVSVHSGRSYTVVNVFFVVVVQSEMQDGRWRMI